MKTSKCFGRASCSWDCKPQISGLIHDPVEESEAYLSIGKEWRKSYDLTSLIKNLILVAGSVPRSHVSSHTRSLVGGRK